MGNRTEFLGQPKGESTPGLGSQIAQRIMPTWSNLGRTDFGAPADPVGALRFPAAGPIATLRIQAQIVSARAKAAGAGLATPNASSFPAYLASLLAHFLSPEGDPGLARVVAANGNVLDSRRSLEDHAWMLRALADSYFATRSRDILLVADLILEFLDRHLANDSIGYFEDNHGGGERRQAGHAHLLDAILTLHAATGSAQYLARAAALFELFRFHMLERESLNVGEAFDRNWRAVPASGEAAFRPASAAHWVVLLRRYHGSSGDDSALDLMRALGQRLVAKRNARGMIVSSLDAFGAAPDASMRMRDQLGLCAALRALGPGERQHSGEVRLLESRIAALFIDPAPTGCWCESVDANGESRGEPISVETLATLVNYAASAQSGQTMVALAEPDRTMHAA